MILHSVFAASMAWSANCNPKLSKCHVCYVVLWPSACLHIVQSTLRITTLGGASEKCPYSRSVVIPEVPSYDCITVGWDFALGMEILSLFANCHYIRSRY